MNFLLAIIVLLFTFSLSNCNNSHQNPADNANQNASIHEDTELENYLTKEAIELHKKTREIENLENPYQVGRKEAQEDAANQRFSIKTTGDPTKEALEWGKILEEKHGIKLHHFGCCPSAKLEKYVQGYNEVSKAEIKKHYGRTILEKTWKEATDKVNK